MDDTNDLQHRYKAGSDIDFSKNSSVCTTHMQARPIMTPSWRHPAGIGGEIRSLGEMARCSPSSGRGAQCTTVRQKRRKRPCNLLADSLQTCPNRDTSRIFIATFFCNSLNLTIFIDLQCLTGLHHAKTGGDWVYILGRGCLRNDFSPLPQPASPALRRSGPVLPRFFCP